MKRPARKLLVLAASSVSGAVWTLLVAWACALWIDKGVEGDVTRGSLEWSVSVPADWPQRAETRATFDPLGWRYVSEATFQRDSQGLESVYSVRVHRAGLPMLALVSHEISWVRDFSPSNPAIPGKIGESHNGIVVPYVWANQGGENGFLPTHPLWVGFAVNTSLFGGLTFALWFLPSAVRRRIRKRAGRCAQCGYDLRGATGGLCPECGSGRSLVCKTFGQK